MEKEDLTTLAAWAKTAGIPGGEVPTVLGVERVSLFTGTLEEAHALLVAAGQTRASVDIEDMPKEEMPAGSSMPAEQKDGLLALLRNDMPGKWNEHTQPTTEVSFVLRLKNTGHEATVVMRDGCVADVAILLVMEAEATLLALLKTGRIEKHVYQEIRTPTANMLTKHNATTVAPPPAKPGGPPMPPMPPAAHTAAPAAPDNNTGIKAGTGKLNGIEIRSNGHVEFNVLGLRYALKDARGAAVVAGLFDADIGWQAEHFAPGSSYSGSDVEGLLVDWKKEGKYYNIICIHR